MTTEHLDLFNFCRQIMIKSNPGRSYVISKKKV